jgi:ABC-type tungstate transport system permease subunit
MLYYTDFVIVSPKDLASALKKVKDQENIRLEFSFNFLRVRAGEDIRISVKAGSGIIKPKRIFTISKEDCQKLIAFYTEHNTSGAFIKLRDNELVFYGWNEEARKDDKIIITVAQAIEKLKAA